MFDVCSPSMLRLSLLQPHNSLGKRLVVGVNAGALANVSNARDCSHMQVGVPSLVERQSFHIPA